MAAGWFAALLLASYGPVLWGLMLEWERDPDMGHGFLVPVMSGYIAWRKRHELAALRPEPNWWGLAVVIYGALQLYIAMLGSELFLARTAFVISLAGMVLLLGGRAYVRALAFPLVLLLFMVQIPAIAYNRITFPLQLLASKAASSVLLLLDVPVLREGNVLELPEQRLSVVEACSGIRSLLSLGFLSLVYGYFIERRRWMRVALLAATVPIAIAANAGRVTLTGLLSQWRPELAEGFFHSASGWVIFMAALFLLISLHQLLDKGYRRLHARR
jgi:exosortase